jgi:hypothetical protein
MTTREAISGRMIAAAGMKDGAAMKALALLTTVFLPGTFLAVKKKYLDRAERTLADSW